MKDRLYQILIVMLVIFSVSLFIKVKNVSKKLISLNNLPTEIKISGDSALINIKTYNQELMEQLNQKFNDTFIKISRSIIDEKIKEFEFQIDSVQKKIAEERTILENIKSQKHLALLGLPEQVDLDDLYDRYKNSSSVSFITEKGSINFFKYNIELAIIPSLQKAAWIRIGKETTAENSELIKAWLTESANMKVKNGYRLIYNGTKDTDYGECTEKYFTKGDMYFLTYYQYVRVLETYKRYSFRYIYYVETGSQQRKELYLREQYNLRLGS